MLSKEVGLEGEGEEGDGETDDGGPFDIDEEEHNGDDDLHRGGPEHMGPLEEIGNSLGVELHEIDNFTKRGRGSCGRTHAQTLIINGTLQGRADLHTTAHCAEKVVVFHHGANERCDEEGDGPCDAHGSGSVWLRKEAEQLVDENGLEEEEGYFECF